VKWVIGYYDRVTLFYGKINCGFSETYKVKNQTNKLKDYVLLTGISSSVSNVN